MTSQTHVGDSVDHLFRHHAGQMVSVLCRIFGVDRIDMIEDAVQDALVSALRRWPFTGMPDNPTAWLTQAAKNRLIDQLRRDGRLDEFDDGVEVLDPAAAKAEKSVFFSSEIAEDTLRMIFACCHPSIAADSQVALTLKIVGGFSVAEIASAYLANEESVAKMITRAKARLRENSSFLDTPVADEITGRLDAVLKVLYLMFNEGYGASGGDELVRRDLCFEAIRLVEILSRHRVTSSPKVHAAAALFHFQCSRLPARTDHAGELVILEEQDRSYWDKNLIAQGLRHFQLSAAGTELSKFHLEAEIASIHALSDDFASINWRRIVDCYTRLQQISFSPVAELNRAIAISQVDGADAALATLELLHSRCEVSRYSLFHITRGHLLTEIGRRADAEVSFKKALSLTRNEAVRHFIERRMAGLNC